MRSLVVSLASIALLSTLATVVRAQQRQIPPVVSSGLDLLVEDRPHDAVSAWGRRWTGADTAQAVTLRASLEQINSLLGRARGYELVRAFEISESLQQLYIVIRFEKQPLYALFVIYRPSDEWQVNAVRWNTDASTVFPQSLVTPP